jgi:hypothetical protein
MLVSLLSAALASVPVLNASVAYKTLTAVNDMREPARGNHRPSRKLSEGCAPEILIGGSSNLGPAYQGLFRRQGARLHNGRPVYANPGKAFLFYQTGSDQTTGWWIVHTESTLESGQTSYWFATSGNNAAACPEDRTDWVDNGQAAMTVADACVNQLRVSGTSLSAMYEARGWASRYHFLHPNLARAPTARLSGVLFAGRLDPVGHERVERPSDLQVGHQPAYLSLRFGTW